jgi:hypothetical protein
MNDISTHFVTHYVVAYLLKAKPVLPEKTSIARDQHGNKCHSVFYAVHYTFAQKQL